MAQATPHPSSHKTDNPQSSRRQWLHSTFLLTMATSTSAASVTTKANAAETVGKDPDCNDRNCLGVWDGLLADCPHDRIGVGAGCVSSQDDTPRIFAEPWDYSESTPLDWEIQMARLIPTIQQISSKRGDTVEISSQVNRYLRVTFIDGKTAERSIGEFYFTPNDTTVQFRVGSLLSSTSSRSSQKNMERCEDIRKKMGYERLPVLRNRKRAFFFGETEWDSFGPGSASLGPPAEMTTGELEGRWDVDPRLKIDAVQGFPFMGGGGK